MSFTAISSAWSLDTSAPSHNHSTTDSSNRWLTQTILCNRWGAHYISILLSIIPSSETLLRDEGLIPFYGHVASLSKVLEGIAQEKQITVPSYPDVPADWKDEAAIDGETLHATLVSQTTGPVKEVIDHMAAALKQGYRWESLVALIGVSANVYLDPVAIARNSAASTAGGTMAPFSQVLSDGVMFKSATVLNKELERYRNGPGWKEEEAKKLSAENLRLLRKYWAH